jgi:hypothetical protein
MVQVDVTLNQYSPASNRVMIDPELNRSVFSAQEVVLASQDNREIIQPELSRSVDTNGENLPGSNEVSTFFLLPKINQTPKGELKGREVIHSRDVKSKTLILTLTKSALYGLIGLSLAAIMAGVVVGSFLPLMVGLLTGATLCSGAFGVAFLSLYAIDKLKKVN